MKIIVCNANLKKGGWCDEEVSDWLMVHLSYLVGLGKDEYNRLGQGMQWCV